MPPHQRFLLLQAYLKKKSLHFKERSKNLFFGIKFWKIWLLTLIKSHYPILLSELLQLSFLVRNRCLLRKKEKDSKSLVRLVLLLQVNLSPCSSFALGRLKTTILRYPISRWIRRDTLKKTIGVTKLDSTLITSSFRTFKWYMKS